MSKKTAKKTETQPPPAREEKESFITMFSKIDSRAETPDPGLPLLAAGHLHYPLRLPGRIDGFGFQPFAVFPQSPIRPRRARTRIPPRPLPEDCRPAVPKNDTPSDVFLLDRVILSLVGRIRIIGESSLKPCARILRSSYQIQGGFFYSLERLKQRSVNGPE